jgi:hypothetical protein
MALNNEALPLLCQLSEYLSEVLTQRAINHFLAPLWNKHDMIFTVPSRVAQTLIFFHFETPSFGRDRSFKATDV